MKNKLFHIAGSPFSFSVLLILLLFPNSFAQMQKFPLQNSDNNYKSSFLFSAPNNNLIYFWYEGKSLLQSRSTDNGTSWGTPSHLADTLKDTIAVRDINCFITASGRMLLIFKDSFYYLKYSDNNGSVWSYPVRLLTGSSILSSYYPYAAHFAQSSSGKIFFTASKFIELAPPALNVNLLSSTDNGLTWSSPTQVLAGPGNASIVPLNGLNLSLYYQDNGIYNLSSTDDGLTWHNPVPVVSDTGVSNPRAIKDQLGRIWLFYIKNIAAPFHNIAQTDIVYKTSTDNGITWSADASFTKFKGNDNFFSVNNSANNPLVSFSSNRNNNSSDHYNIWYGIAGVTNDNDTPPYLYQYKTSNQNPPVQTPVKFSLYIDFTSPLSSVELIRNLNGNVLALITFHDDGLQEDSIANDKIYSCSLPGLSLGDLLSTSFKIQDQAGHIINAVGPTIIIPLANYFNTQRIFTNNIDLPINNSGVLGDVVINGALGGGKLDGKVVLFSGGFFMSGLTNGVIWANGMISASRITDYIPGKVGSASNDPKNVIFVFASSDPDFGQSWKDWALPVSMGADFYDGNHDGIYNPVDLNSNGKWDPDEDRPASMGDLTTWCVYNDGLASSLRTYTDVAPQGIEIQQTVFAKNTKTGDLANTIFVKYRLLNTGTKSDVLNSVYFSPAADNDIGDQGMNDLDGCDTLLNAAYTYHSPASPDGKFGTTPPAVFVAGLQGPRSYIPGVTFLDLNSNGTYDPGVDTPIDTAFSRNGIAGIKKYPGAKNLGLSSFIQYYNGIDPANKSQARFYTLGKNNTGSFYYPCTWPQGTVIGGVNCSSVNPLFMYSGDPVTSVGWINNTAKDQRFISNYGPFDLIKNQPVDIIVAYVVGRGSDALNSIYIARLITKSAKDYYSGNFDWGTTSVNDKNNPVIKSYSLEQNYPNPFNPSTKIQYSLPFNSHVKLTIYNTIGQAVKVLVNDIQSSGSHEINFNASLLSSGVYFYSIQTNSIDGKQNYSNTKKMILLK